MLVVLLNNLLKTWSIASPKSLRTNAMPVNKGSVSDRRLIDESRNPIAKELMSCRDEASLFSE